MLANPLIIKSLSPVCHPNVANSSGICRVILGLEFT